MVFVLLCSGVYLVRYIFNPNAPVESSHHSRCRQIQPKKNCTDNESCPWVSFTVPSSLSCLTPAWWAAHRCSEHDPPAFLAASLARPTEGWHTRDGLERGTTTRRAEIENEKDKYRRRLSLNLGPDLSKPCYSLVTKTTSCMNLMRQRKQQLLCIYSSGEHEKRQIQLHQNISECFQVASSDVHCWDLPTSSAGLIRVQKKKKKAEEAVAYSHRLTCYQDQEKTSTLFNKVLLHGKSTMLQFGVNLLSWQPSFVYTSVCESSCLCERAKKLGCLTTSCTFSLHTGAHKRQGMTQKPKSCRAVLAPQWTEGENDIQKERERSLQREFLEWGSSGVGLLLHIEGKSALFHHLSIDCSVHMTCIPTTSGGLTLAYNTPPL